MIFDAMARSWQDELIFGPVGRNRFLVPVGEYQILYDMEPRQHALMLSLGLCLARIQSFEFMVHGILSLHDEKAGLDREQQEEGYRNATLGNLIKIIDRVSPGHSLGSLLNNAKEKRDRFVHRLLIELGWPMTENEKYIDALKIMVETEEAISAAERALVRFMKTAHDLPIITGEELDTLMAEAKARKKD